MLINLSAHGTGLKINMNRLHCRCLSDLNFKEYEKEFELSFFLNATIESLHNARIHTQPALKPIRQRVAQPPYVD